MSARACRDDKPNEFPASGAVGISQDTPGIGWGVFEKPDAAKAHPPLTNTGGLIGRLAHETGRLNLTNLELLK